MQDPNQDTEWNDVLRAKGIIPAKDTLEVTEQDLVNMVEAAIEQKSKGKDMSEMKLNELNELEDELDEEDEKVFEAYRRQRLQELKSAQLLARFGDVREISRDDYVREVNKAGEGIWVVLLVYKTSVPMCKLLEQYFYQLAAKFPATKFLKSISSVCIPNYPDKNLPTVFVYCDGDLRKQFVGPAEFGGTNLTCNELEWMLSKAGAFKTELEEPPRKAVHDVMASSVRNATVHDSDDDDDD
jgi:hypothetical protein